MSAQSGTEHQELLDLLGGPVSVAAFTLWLAIVITAICFLIATWNHSKVSMLACVSAELLLFGMLLHENTVRTALRDFANNKTPDITNMSNSLDIAMLLVCMGVVALIGVAALIVGNVLIGEDTGEESGQAN